MKLQRKLLKLSGKDATRFLNDLLTISVSEDMPMRYGALLTPQGKILSDVFLSRDEGAYLLDLPDSQFEITKTKLSQYKLRADVQFGDDPRAVFQINGVGDPRGDVGQRVYGDAPSWSEAEYTQARIRAVVPEFGIDFDTGHAYPREWRFDEMAGVDYRKGCFVGQEIVARMRHKSELLKSVVRVRSERSLMMGQVITSGERAIGEILSYQANEALAFLRLKSVDLQSLKVNGEPLTLDNIG